MTDPSLIYPTSPIAYGLDILRIWKDTAARIRKAPSERDWRKQCSFVVFAQDPREAGQLLSVLQDETEEHMRKRGMAHALSGLKRVPRSFCMEPKPDEDDDDQRICIFKFEPATFKMERAGVGKLWVHFGLAYPVHLEIVRYVLFHRGVVGMACSLHLRHQPRNRMNVPCQTLTQFEDVYSILEHLDVPILEAGKNEKKRDREDETDANGEDEADRSKRCKTNEDDDDETLGLKDLSVDEEHHDAPW